MKGWPINCHFLGPPNNRTISCIQGHAHQNCVISWAKSMLTWIGTDEHIPLKIEDICLVCVIWVWEDSINFPEPGPLDRRPPIGYRSWFTDNVVIIFL